MAVALRQEETASNKVTALAIRQTIKRGHGKMRAMMMLAGDVDMQKLSSSDFLPWAKQRGASSHRIATCIFRNRNP
jgi:hypothetical protein